MMNILIPPYLSKFPYAKMCAIADGAELSEKMPGAKPAARKDIAHFGLERGAQEMEGVYRGVAE
ncbi:MAG: hypothetical protein ABIF85_03480 [Nanoarchaeota archaeon]|nr:hypothetical protein [Nanoarchaeota archaeon]MBU4452027.1 hypothetical protein [Nanoarchaeota archaeon]MCG2723871.1 hypothetical protein [archaeon]